MPSVQENKDQWSNHDWSTSGDEWSVGYGGTETMWAWTIQPRIAGFLPAEHILEIAPGFGRLTQYLAPACERLTVVDLTERCIEACRERFKDRDNITYHVNDGRSLDMVEDGSVDFVFSWDSLIHVEEDVIAAYLTQLAKKLKPGGTGVLHHSNLNAYHDKKTGELTIQNGHWRAASMSAEKFREHCQSAGMTCVLQELVPWGGPAYTDCISVFQNKPKRPLARTRVIENDRFFLQVQTRAAEEIRTHAGRFRI